MTQPEGRENERLQKRLRFLMRAYIACWLVIYFGIKRQADVLGFYDFFVSTGLSPLAFVWPAAFLAFAPIAAVYLFFTRRPAEPDESWRQIDADTPEHLHQRDRGDARDPNGVP